MNAITIEHVRAGALRENGHANYGTGGYGYLLQHTTIPRLSAIDRFYKGKAATEAGTSSARIWCVDGVESPSLEVAIERLNVPAVFTEQEREVLSHIPAEWTVLHPFQTFLAGQLGRPVGTTILMLRQKGAIENELRPGPERSLPFIRLRAPALAPAPSEV